MHGQNIWLKPHEVEKAVGRAVCVKTINAYADRGLIECRRDSTGRRRYRPGVVPVLLKHLGLIEETGE